MLSLVELGYGMMCFSGIASTLFPINQVFAWSNSTLARSVPVQHIAYSQRPSRKWTPLSTNSR